MAGLIRAQGLCKTYGTGESAVHALLPCDLKIREGETVAVVGASGSGKSTLLHLLGGLDAPTGGKVFFREKELTALNDDALSEFRRRHVGFVFQNYNLVPELTAGENIELPLLLDGKKPDRDYLDPVIDRLGLRDRLAHYPGELSGGQQQRVAIARALSARPDLLLCDEPTGNLDSATGREVVRLLHEVAEGSGIALVLVTHDREVAATAQRVLTIADGQVGGDLYES